MNTQAQYTPGPWEARESCVIGPNGRVVVACVEGFVSRGDNDEDYATARLIAAAPELLALALRVSSLNPDAGEIGDGTLHQLVDAARAALAKATQA